jgi:hypothetical protein
MWFEVALDPIQQRDYVLTVPAHQLVICLFPFLKQKQRYGLDKREIGVEFEGQQTFILSTESRLPLGYPGFQFPSVPSELSSAINPSN